MALTVADAETPVAELTVTATSADQTLVADADIVILGVGGSRTLTATPALDQNGSKTITVTVSDGVLTGTAAFELTVRAVDDAPSVTSIADQVTMQNTETGAITFTVTDDDTAVTDLVVTASSADQTLVPDTNISTDPMQTSLGEVTVTPATDETGTTTITLTVSDGTSTVETTFGLTVMPAGPFTLSLVTSGTGTGQIVSEPAGISCGADCDEEYPSGTDVTLTPVPDAGSVFAGWVGSASCVMNAATMTDDTSCTARFTTVTAKTAATDRLDFNADGLSDAFTYDPLGGTWSVEVSDGSGGFSVQAGQWSPGWTVTPADFDGNGLSDLFLHDEESGRWFVATSTGAGFRYTGGQWSPGWGVLAMDLNGDGRSDLFVHNATTGDWYQAVTTGEGQFSYAVGQWSPGWTLVRARSNLDARDDLFLYNATSGDWFRATTDGAGGFGYVAGAWSPGWTVMPLSLNGDGLTDLVVTDLASDQWYAVTTTPSDFAYEPGQWAADATTTITALDLSGDGQDDLFVYRAGTGSWMEVVDPSGGTVAQATDFWSPGWIVHAGRFDDDGHEDLLVYNPVTGSRIVGRRQAAGGFVYTPGTFGVQRVVLTRPVEVGGLAARADGRQ